MRFSTSDGSCWDTDDLLLTPAHLENVYEIYSTHDHARVFMFTLSDERGIECVEPDDLVLCSLVEKSHCPDLEAALHQRIEALV